MIRTVADFEDASAFERYAIQEALGTSPSGPSSSAIDLTEPGPKKIAVNLSENLSAGAVSTTVNKLKPLLFGAAYKVLDLLIELALNSAGLIPNRDRWSFEEKVRHAQARAGTLVPLTSSASWPVLCELYERLLELRHSLVHRTATLGADGTLKGVMQNGAPTHALTPDEQTEFSLVVLAVGDAVVRQDFGGRVDARVAERLNRLSAVHGSAPLSNVAGADHMPVLVRARLETLPDGRFRLDRDAPLNQARQVFSTASEFDGEFVGLDAEGRQRTYHCQLEQVSEAVVDFDPANPPGWLRETPASAT